FSESIHPLEQFYGGAYSSVIKYAQQHQYTKSNWPTPPTTGSTVQIGPSTHVAALTSDMWTDTFKMGAKLSGIFGAYAPTYPAGRPYIIGETDLVGSGGSGDPSDRSADTNAIWLHMMVWSLLNPGLALVWLWYVEEWWYDANDGSPNRLAIFKRFSDFMRPIP